MSLESEIENQPFAVRRVVLASGWRQGLTSLFKLTQGDVESLCVQHLSTIYDVGQTLSQLLFNVLSLLACQYTCLGPI